MTLAKPSTISAARTRPLVWVRKLVLLKSIEPWDEIRQIEFSTGLNIIQGELNESDEDFQTGHGIGKTTVCRLIRYCLGEDTFGQSHVVEEVKSNFRDGYVGAEIELDGTAWAVLLPFRKSMKKYAAQVADIGGLVRAEGAKRYDDFIEKLSATVLANVTVTETLTGGQTLVWAQVLAMCSRDQECRYDRYWNWRDKRSDARTPAFKKPKVDAGLCVKAILGLLDSKEVKLRTTQEELEKTIGELKTKISKTKERPAAAITDLRTRLETEFGVSDAKNAPLNNSFTGLDYALSARTKTLTDQIGTINEQLTTLNRQIPLMAASLLEPEEMAEALKATGGGTAAVTNSMLNNLEELRQVREMIRDAENARCRHGSVRIGDCSYVQARIGQLDSVLRDQQRTDLPVVAEREQAEARLSAQAQRQRELVARIQRQVDDSGRQRDGFVEQRSTLRTQLETIPKLRKQITDWDEILAGKKPDTEIQDLERQLAETEKKLDGSKAKLEKLIVDQRKRAADFSTRFNALVQRTVPVHHNGMVEINEEEVNFQILRGVSVSGEAIETLAILLGDLALLFESKEEHSRHPGLLIHDSPREADLKEGIYRRMLNMVDEIAKAHAELGDVPFQYIVTTTTPPAKPLQKKSITKIELGEGERSLFKMQLVKKQVDAEGLSLFDQEGEG